MRDERGEKARIRNSGHWPPRPLIGRNERPTHSPNDDSPLDCAVPKEGRKPGAKRSISPGRTRDSVGSRCPLLAFIGTDFHSAQLGVISPLEDDES